MYSKDSLANFVMYKIANGNTHWDHMQTHPLVSVPYVSRKSS